MFPALIRYVPAMICEDRGNDLWTRGLDPTGKRLMLLEYLDPSKAQ
jgi:hypothetical protein